MNNEGFFMPAEWERHEGTWLQWPHDKPHSGYQLKLERMWLQMVAALHRYETNSHIDIVARFANESTVLYNWTDDASDPRYPMLKRHYQELQEATTESGKSLTLVPLPMPVNGVYCTSGMAVERTTTLTDAAYSNYLVANGVVLVPVFGNANDERAKAIIGEQFPDRAIVGIDSVALVENGGAIHCVTQQQPAVPG